MNTTPSQSYPLRPRKKEKVDSTLLTLVTVLTWFILIPSFVMSIVAITRVNNSSNASISPDDTVRFTSALDFTFVNSTNNTTMTLSVWGEKIWIVVDTWIGQCRSFGSPHYAPSFPTVTAIPNKFRPVNSTSGDFIASPIQLFVSSSNATLGTGQSYVQADGTVIFYYNINNVSLSFEGDCIVYSFVMTYLKKYT